MYACLAWVEVRIEKLFISFMKTSEQGRYVFSTNSKIKREEVIVLVSLFWRAYADKSPGILKQKPHVNRFPKFETVNNFTGFSSRWHLPGLRATLRSTWNNIIVSYVYYRMKLLRVHTATTHTRFEYKLKPYRKQLHWNLNRASKVDSK